MGIRIDSITAAPPIDVDQLAIELLSIDANNTAELGSDARILVKPSEKQASTLDLVAIYRLAS